MLPELSAAAGRPRGGSPEAAGAQGDPGGPGGEPNPQPEGQGTPGDPPPPPRTDPQAQDAAERTGWRSAGRTRGYLDDILANRVVPPREIIGCVFHPRDELDAQTSGKNMT